MENREWIMMLGGKLSAVGYMEKKTKRQSWYPEAFCSKSQATNDI